METSERTRSRAASNSLSRMSDRITHLYISEEQRALPAYEIPLAWTALRKEVPSNAFYKATLCC